MASEKRLDNMTEQTAADTVERRSAFVSGIEAETAQTGGMDSTQVRAEISLLYPDVIPEHHEAVSEAKESLRQTLDEIEGKDYLSETGKKEEREAAIAVAREELKRLEREHLEWLDGEIERLSRIESAAEDYGDEEMERADNLEKSAGEFASEESYTELSTYQKVKISLEAANNRLLRELAAAEKRREWAEIISRRPFDSINIYRDAVRLHRTDLVKYFEENFKLLSTDGDASKQFERLKEARIAELDSRLGDVPARKRVLLRYFDDYQTGRLLSKRALNGVG